jgi:hypothetical protein
MAEENLGTAGAPDAGAIRRQAEDEILIEALAEGRTYAAAAALTAGSARTVRRRMTDPDFAAQVSRRRAERVSELTGALVSLSARALQTLEECLDAERPGDRIRAAQVVLGAVHRYREATEFEARLTELETAATGTTGGTGAGS